ncbi:MAG TPA: pyrroloquinoline quinone biosynthesis peptide chaperone PqqD [Steroidobacteraceae bacterium]|jgi:pyrroloquinoline quinone biosynthesis protein D|nr:pyrroloquinoline quinone biosynthesis peptide chaperone PqqD [Steroidobacteraceae bacterium]
MRASTGPFRGMKEYTVARAGKVRLAPGRQLQKDAAGQGPILMSRAGPVRLNETAATILELCDGTRTREGIVARVVRMKNDDGLADDVRDFLDAARRRGWIVEE